MSGLKCDAVPGWLGGCQFGSDHDFWLLVGYVGALQTLINGASGCAGMFFFFCLFLSLSVFLQYWSALLKP